MRGTHVTMRRTRFGGTTLLRLLALLAVFGLLAAACGGDDDDGGGGDSASDEEQDRGAQEFEDEVSGEPQRGGTIVYGIEADTSNPWTPARSTCAISCHQVFKSIYDTLMEPDEEGIPQPNLLESISSNEDFTEWTLTPRAGVTFHDGTPFDADAITVNINDQKTSSLTKDAFKSLDAAATQGTTSVVTMNEPWRGFPYALTGQLGAMGSPTWLRGVQASTAQATEPVGTGPFVFEEYVVGDHFTATANPDYWKQGPDGEELPYADGIEYRILEEGEARINALESGQVNVAHTSSGALISRIRDLTDSGDLATVESDAFGETGYLLLNHDDSPGTAANPALQDVNVRRALAMAVDFGQIRDDIGEGVAEVANGPFPPGTVGYLEDTGYPTYDPAEAARLIEEYEADNGPVQVAFSTTTDPEGLETNQVIQGYWEAAGVETDLNQVEQGQYILDAAFGDFELFSWRNHGGYDADQQNHWWHSDAAKPKEQIALNFGRIKDDDIDAALDTIRSSGDDAERKEAAETINRTFGEQVYNIWGTWTVWAWGHAPEVHGIDNAALPDGTKAAFPITDKYAHDVGQIWIEQ
jgi:peptide/nickel transport system substrate-binding protein